MKAISLASRKNRSTKQIYQKISNTVVYINTNKQRHTSQHIHTHDTMFALRLSAARVAARSFSSARVVLNAPKVTIAKNLAEVHGSETLISTGAKEGTFPTDLEQATGLERLELLAKLEGVEFFDTKPLDSSRIGTMADPILVESYDDYRYIGCTGAPADSHHIMWLKPTVEQAARCWECGSVYKLKPVGVPQEEHH